MMRRDMINTISWTIPLQKNAHTKAPIVNDPNVDIVAGTLFITTNDIAVRHAKHEIIIAGSDTVSYGFPQTSQTNLAIRACHLLCATGVNTTV